MPIPPLELLTGCVIPALVSLLCWLGWSKWLTSAAGQAEGSSRFATWKSPLCLMAGFLVGYGLLGLAPWKPESHWHYLVYSLFGVSVLTPAVFALTGSVWLRFFGTALLCLPAFWVLEPKWDLTLAKQIYFPLVVVLSSLQAICFGQERSAEEEPREGGGPLFSTVVLCGVLFAVIVQTFLSGSLLFTQLAMLGASCFAGLVWLRSFRDELAYAAAWFAVLTVGMLSIAEVNSFSSVPSVTYLIIALAPISRWLVSPLAATSYGKHLQWIVPMLLVLVALTWAGVAELGDGSEY